MSQSTLEKVAESICITQGHMPTLAYRYLKEAKAAIEAMRILVKNDPAGCQTDDLMLQKYIDNALK